MSKPVILTGLRANNDLHIGNYLGALLPIVDMANKHADDYQINLFVPDLHSFTTPINHGKLYEQTLQNIQLFIAAGLNISHPNVHIYRQSYIPAHSELTWILDCFTGFGEMSRMTQFKDKATKLSADRVSVGLFNYPVLMAADILLYGATYVPVGEDQTQHLEFTRDIAERFNKKFGEVFVVPKSVKEQHQFFGKDQGLRVKDLADPSKKMSKSDVSEKGIIFLNDLAEKAREKIKGATTDSLAKIKYDPENQPGVSNLLQILALLTHKDMAEVSGEYQSQTSYGPLKEAASEAVVAFLNDFQSRLSKVDQNDVLTKLESSEKAMNEQASKTLLEVQKTVGLRPK